MFDHYRSRMAHRGANQSEMLRLQSNMVIEQTWDRDPNYRRVYVVKVNRGLPEVTSKHELVDAKFNVDTYQKVGSDEPAYHLQFKRDAEKHNPDIGVGSYVHMEDEDGGWKWWMITSLDERPQFRQYTINECNWKLGWVVGGKIYYTLGILRNGSTTREADENSYTTAVNGNAVFWASTNAETQLIGHNQRFLISDVGRMPPLAFSVGSISDTRPIGITKFVLTQTTYDSNHDNADLMLASYYADGIEPVEPDIEQEFSGTASITFSGTKPTVKVGGSAKIFTPAFSVEGTTVAQWLVSDENGDISGDTNYTIERDGENLKIKVGLNYNLIGTVLIVQCVGSDGSTAELSVEVI